MSQRGNTPGRPRRSRPTGFRVTHEIDARYAGGRRRVRYVGRGARGAPSPAARDLLDVRVALHELAHAQEMLIRLDVNAELSQQESIALHDAIRGKIALAGRAVDAVVLRSRSAWANRRAA